MNLAERIANIIPKEFIEKERKIILLINQVNDSLSELKAMGIDCSLSINADRFIEEEELNMISP